MQVRSEMHLQNIYRMSKSMIMTSKMVVMKPTQNEVYAQIVHEQECGNDTWDYSYTGNTCMVNISRNRWQAQKMWINLILVFESA